MESGPPGDDNALLRELARQRAQRKQASTTGAGSSGKGGGQGAQDDDIILIGEDLKEDCAVLRKRKESEQADMALAARLQREEQEHAMALLGSHGASGDGAWASGAGGAWESGAASASGWGQEEELAGGGAWDASSMGGDPALVDEQVPSSLSPGLVNYSEVDMQALRCKCVNFVGGKSPG